VVELAKGNGPLKLFVWLAALPCMAVEVFAKWLCFSLTKQLKGFQFPLLLIGNDVAVWERMLYLLSYTIECETPRAGLMNPWKHSK
jgi:hypothetical protein